MTRAKRSEAPKTARVQPKYSHCEESQPPPDYRRALAAAELLIHRALLAGEATGDKREVDRVLREGVGRTRRGRGVRWDEDLALDSYRMLLDAHRVVDGKRVDVVAIETDVDALVLGMRELEASGSTVGDGLPPGRGTYIRTPQEPAAAVHLLARAYGATSAEAFRVWLDRRRRAARRLRRDKKLPPDRAWVADLQVPTWTKVLRQVPPNL